MDPPVKSEKMTSTCSHEADLRKNGQHVVSYSLFGDTNEEVIKRRYFSSLKQRADRVAQVYPGQLTSSVKNRLRVPCIGYSSRITAMISDRLDHANLSQYFTEPRR